MTFHLKNLVGVLSVLLVGLAWTSTSTSSSIGAGTLPSMFGGRIKHVIAIMFENRSFDHLLGHLVSVNPAVDGCSPSIPSCKCPLDPSDSSSEEVPVGLNAVYIQPGDPSHSISGTTYQLYAAHDNNVETYPAPMTGFVKDYAGIDHSKQDEGRIIMQLFNSTSLPILSTLATDFAVFNSWFCDVPGPTEPNRLYSWMTTSQGLGNDNADRLAEGFIGRNIFEMFDKYWNYTDIPSTKKWRAYWQTFPTPIFVEYTRLHPENGHFMDEFFDDLQKGDLPLFSWLDPNYSEMPGFPATDQHPDHDVLEGEKLTKRIYEALRASPVWNDTLLLIFYDEHGGFYDHVSPSLAPNPDNINCTKYGGPFDFHRLGLRVPSVLVSPWMPASYVIPKPASTPAHNEAQYSHSSLTHTLREQFTPNSPPLTLRDSWSKTFEDAVMQLQQPRTDCPMTLPAVPKGNIYNRGNRRRSSASSQTKGLMHAVGRLCNKDPREVDALLATGDSYIYGPPMMECVRQWQSGEVVYQPQ